MLGEGKDCESPNWELTIFIVVTHLAGLELGWIDGLGDSDFLFVRWLEARTVLLLSDIDGATVVFTGLVWNLYFDFGIGVTVLVVVMTTMG